MKVVAFNGSARKDGNTAILIGYELGDMADELIAYGADHVVVVNDESLPVRLFLFALEQVELVNAIDDPIIGNCESGYVRKSR